MEKRPPREKRTAERRRILPVDQDGMPHFSQVNPDLMRSSRHRAAKEKRRLLSPSHDLPMGCRQKAAGPRSPNRLPLESPLPNKPALSRSSVLFDDPVHDGQVFFFDFALGEKLSQRIESLRIFCQGEHARRIFVQTMH